MINSKVQIGLIAGALIALGIGLTLYKAISLDLPLVPDQYREVWTVESKTSFTPTRTSKSSQGDLHSKAPVNVELRLPSAQAGWVILEEHFASSGFGFSIIEQGAGNVARWTRQQLDRPTTLYYKMQVYRASDNLGLPALPVSQGQKPLLEADQQAAMDRLLERLQRQSSGVDSFVQLLLQEFLRDSPDQDMLFLIDSYEDDSFAVLMDVLAMAEISAHQIRGIVLEDGRRRQTLSSLIEIHNGERWNIFDPATASAGLPENFFIWQRGDGSILNVVGGRDSSLEFALVSNRLPAKAVVGMEQRSDKFALLDFSIYT
ncbi:MAG: UUP1 family membrane protein, partial [Porticoccaceae bacterium]